MKKVYQIHYLYHLKFKMKLLQYSDFKFIYIYFFYEIHTDLPLKLCRKKQHILCLFLIHCGPI